MRCDAVRRNGPFHPFEYSYTYTSVYVPGPRAKANLREYRRLYAAGSKNFTTIPKIGEKYRKMKTDTK